MRTIDVEFVENGDVIEQKIILQTEDDFSNLYDLLVYHLSEYTYKYNDYFEKFEYKIVCFHIDANFIKSLSSHTVYLRLSMKRYEDAINWCRKNCQGKWFIDGKYISFEYESDCALYKLIGID